MKGFSISRRQNVKENINRILLGQVDYILEHCENDQKDMHASIHEIRKSIKRIRAVLRLIREEIGYSTYYRENVFYRDMSRSISDLRTYNVLILSLENLLSDLSKNLPSKKVEPLIASIRLQRDNKLSEILTDDKALRDLSVSFTEARKRIPDLPVEHDGFEVFAGGIFRMYQQGKDFLSSAQTETGTHLLHNMRKRMKYLWYQIEILKPIYPGALKAFANSLEDISERLGIYHDLAVLSEFLQEHDGGLEGKIQETLQDACEFKKSALLKGILRKAGTAFSEEPEALVQRMDEYWKVYYRQKS